MEIVLPSNGRPKNVQLTKEYSSYSELFFKTNNCLQLNKLFVRVRWPCLFDVDVYAILPEHTWTLCLFWSCD